MRLQGTAFWGVLGLAACLHGVARGQGDGTAGAGADVRASFNLPAAGPVEAGRAGAAPASGALPDAAGAPCDQGPFDQGPFDVPPLAAERLAQLRGGTETVWNDMKLNGTVAGNAAVNVATGANIITNGSFSNASGLPVAIQNSGANVLIQNATIINVQLQ